MRSQLLLSFQTLDELSRPGSRSRVPAKRFCSYMVIGPELDSGMSSQVSGRYGRQVSLYMFLRLDIVLIIHCCRCSASAQGGA